MRESQQGLDRNTIFGFSYKNWLFSLIPYDCALGLHQENRDALN